MAEYVNNLNNYTLKSLPLGEVGGASFMFKNYLTIALRNLSRNKVYSFINIAGLSIGLACAMLIILYVKDEVSYDRFHKNVSNIYRITTQSIDKNGVKGARMAIPVIFQARVLHKMYRK